MVKLPLHQSLFKLVVHFTVVRYARLLHHPQIFHYFVALCVILSGTFFFPLNNEYLFFHLCNHLHKMFTALAVRCQFLPQHTVTLEELIKVPLQLLVVGSDLPHLHTVLLVEAHLVLLQHLLDCGHET